MMMTAPYEIEIKDIRVDQSMNIFICYQMSMANGNRKKLVKVAGSHTENGNQTIRLSSDEMGAERRTKKKRQTQKELESYH